MAYAVPKIEEDELDLKVPDEIPQPFWLRYTSEPSSSRSSVPPEISRELVLLVYREVWEEFHVWEQATAERAIAEINGHTHARVDPFDEDLSAPTRLRDYAPEYVEDSDVVNSDHSDDFLLQTLNSEPRIYRTEIILAPDIKPYPEYESCTPSKTNLGPRRYQAFEHETLNFFPTVDDPDFSKEEFADEFEWFAWQREAKDHQNPVKNDLNYRNPDVEEIQLETMKRLMNIPGATLQAIDDTGILRRSHVTEQDGTLWLSNQRDGLWWSGMTTALPKLLRDTPYPALFQSSKSDVPRRVGRLRRDFCENRNCLWAYCRGHPHDEHQLDESVPVRQPRVKNNELRRRVNKPCGEHCFVMIAGEGRMVTEWTEANIETLRALLTVCPDTLPCHLVWACRKRCEEIYIQRKQFILDEDIDNSQDSNAVDDEMQSQPNIMEGNGLLIPPPCKHTGPCGRHAGCSCWNEGVYCQRTCSCSKHCIQRWKGCTCALKRSKEVCGVGDNSRCPCVIAKRECDPELCRKCCTKRHHQFSRCRNMQLQQGIHKQLVIAPAKYGAGAHFGEDVKGGELIGEYVGEYVARDVSDIRDMIIRARRRNYTFTVGDEVLDAITVANETRFPNHSKEESNCFPREVNVNGQYRLGLFASRTIREYEEMLFDYGDKFFQDD